MIQIKDNFLNHSLEYFKEKVMGDNSFLFNYNEVFDRFSFNHPLYKNNWRVNFLDDHRYMNWILYTFLKNAKEEAQDVLFTHDVFNKDFTVMDIGCYDSCLVKSLNDII